MRIVRAPKRVEGSPHPDLLAGDFPRVSFQMQHFDRCERGKVERERCQAIPGDVEDAKVPRARGQGIRYHDELVVL